MRKEKFLIMIKFIILGKIKIQKLMENQITRMIRILYKKIPQISKAVAVMKKMGKKKKSIFTIMDLMMKKEIIKL
jgi:hypothetical protein